MTHEELLAKVNKPLNKVFANHQEVKDLQAALRAVVELIDNPPESIQFWSEEGKMGYDLAMLKVINVIEKELG